MSLCLYFVPFIGTGLSLDSFRPIASQGVQLDFCDGRPNQSLIAGETTLILNVTPAEHATMIGTAGVVYAPFENLGGVPQGPAQPFSSVSAANQTSCINLFEARHIPMHDVVGTYSIKRIWHRAFIRLLCRQMLAVDDWTTGLDTLTSGLLAAQRANIVAKLQAKGYDTTTIVGTDTIRETIRKLAVRNVALFKIGSGQ